MVQNDKMLSRKDGPIGYVIFNNPERHNAVSLDMWAAAGKMLDEFRDEKLLQYTVISFAEGFFNHSAHRGLILFD